MERDWRKFVVINPIDVIFRDLKDAEGLYCTNIDI